MSERVDRQEQQGRRTETRYIKEEGIAAVKREGWDAETTKRAKRQGERRIRG